MLYYCTHTRRPRTQIPSSNNSSLAVFQILTNVPKLNLRFKHSSFPPTTHPHTHTPILLHHSQILLLQYRNRVHTYYCLAHRNTYVISLISTSCNHFIYPLSIHKIPCKSPSYVCLAPNSHHCLAHRNTPIQFPIHNPHLGNTSYTIPTPHNQLRHIIHILFCVHVLISCKTSQYLSLYPLSPYTKSHPHHHLVSALHQTLTTALLM